MAANTAGIDVALLGTIALGGAIGALTRYGVSLWVPHRGDIPWHTLAVNVIGCFLIGVLMVCITEIWAAHRLLRPFLGSASSADSPPCPPTPWKFVHCSNRAESAPVSATSGGRW
nr:CrcB family protein [Nocardia tengchongensis]